MKIDKRSYKNIFIFYIGRVTIKHSKYIKINSANPYTSFSAKRMSTLKKLIKIRIEEINKNKYLMVINKKYKLFDVTKFILVLPTFRLIQQSLSRARCRMKSLHSVSKLLSNGT